MNPIYPKVMKIVPSLSSLREWYPDLTTVLFDMDGTLFDTEKYHSIALEEMGREHNILPPVKREELHRMMMGKADHLLFQIIKDWPGFPGHWGAEIFIQEKNRQMLKILKSVQSEHFLQPSVKLLLNECVSQGINLGLVTSSEKIITLELLGLSELEQHFKFILTRDDTPFVKPDPWPYLKAMEYFKTQKDFTLIFEDSAIGLTAAKASGAHCIEARWYYG